MIRLALSIRHGNETMELKELAPRSAAETASAILNSALELFCDLGYHSTTMAAIGRGANIEGPSIYHHFPSKQAMLQAITSKTFDDLQTIFDNGMAATEGESPSVRMAEAVRGYVLFHTHHRREAFVGASEIRSLEPEFRAALQIRRREYGQGFDDLISSGVKAGQFEVDSVLLTSFGILQMGAGVARWYRSDGPFRPQEIAANYVAIAMRMLGVPPAKARALSRHNLEGPSI
jgi:AcrR family transcriptional regulator